MLQPTNAGVVACGVTERGGGGARQPAHRQEVHGRAGATGPAVAGRPFHRRSTVCGILRGYTTGALRGDRAGRVLGCWCTGIVMLVPAVRLCKGSAAELGIQQLGASILASGCRCVRSSCRRVLRHAAHVCGGFSVPFSRSSSYGYWVSCHRVFGCMSRSGQECTPMLTSCSLDEAHV